MIEPTIVLAEEYFQLQVQLGQAREINVPLTARTIAGMVFGLLILQLLGDQHLASQWQKLPAVLGTMIVDGLKPAGGPGPTDV